MSDDPLLITLPLLVKALPSEDGRRVVSVEASNECVDQESDVILQDALLGSASYFLEKGVIDRDHLSEIGDRIPGLRKAPSDYVIGRPLEVNDLGGGRTGVVCELNKSEEATAIWNSLHQDPPVNWRASIYGFPQPGGFHDNRLSKSELAPQAGRFVVSKLQWRSLALTRNPVNNAITGSAQIITAKAFIAGITDEVAKGDLAPMDTVAPLLSSNFIEMPRNTIEMLGHAKFHCDDKRCPGVREFGRSVAGFKVHFIQCCGAEISDAHLKAHAMMNLLKHNNSDK